MKVRDQLSLSEIAKRIGLTRNTVKKWLVGILVFVSRNGKHEERVRAISVPGRALAGQIH